MDNMTKCNVIATPDTAKESPCGDNFFNNRTVKCELSQIPATNAEGERVAPCMAECAPIKEEPTKQVLLVKKIVSEQQINDEASHRPRHGEQKGKKFDHNEFGSQMNQLVMQAALGGCRWPPYLLVVWILLLIISHTLHCLVTLMLHSLPYIRKLSQYLRTKTEETWLNKIKTDSHRQVVTGCLAVATAISYALYFGLYAIHSTTVWFLEPLNSNNRNANILDGKTSNSIIGEDVNITNYEDISSRRVSQNDSGAKL